MDYIDTLLIMEDDLDEVEDLGEFCQLSTEQPTSTTGRLMTQDSENQDQAMASVSGIPDWCVCGRCRPMPQEVENKCFNLKTCITLSPRFTKLCLDPDVVELCIKNTGDIRNDREDNSSRAFRKAAYRQFILARHGRLRKGNRRVCPSCVVLKIREQWPSITGVYMGYRDIIDLKFEWLQGFLQLLCKQCSGPSLCTYLVQIENEFYVLCFVEI